MARRWTKLFKFETKNRIGRSEPRRSREPVPRVMDVLETRELMATFAVTSLADSGMGSLRQAINNSNASAGADTIVFNVAGTIRVGKTSLPAISDPVTINGTSSPSFRGSPVVTVDFHRTNGLLFANGSAGSNLLSLSLVNAKNSGVTLSAPRVTVQGDYIGVLSDGRTTAANGGDGVRINASSHNDLIGNNNPISGVTFHNTNNVGTQPVSAWQGIRGGDAAGQYLITGTSNANGLLFVGSIDGQGKSFAVNVPGAATTSVYGPNYLGGNLVQLVGSYKTPTASTDAVTVNGFLYQGTTSALPSGGTYTTVDYPGAKYNYVHSTMGGLAVGNYDGPTTSGQAIGAGQAYIYDTIKGTFLTHVVFPGSTSDTAYGIWYNGGTSYTLCGGYSNSSVNNLNDQNQPIGQAYLVDYDTVTGQFSNWKSFSDPNGAVGTDYITHFEGISSVEKGVYTLSADSLQSGSNSAVQGSWVTVRRNTDGSFGDGQWVDLNHPGPANFVSSNSVYGNQVVGIVVGLNGVSSYQATVDTAYQRSNVISGNRGNGIGIYGARGNQVATNYIGTDSTGTIALGNGQNGILVTNAADANLIGGQATGGNDPTSGVYATPPLGNLISGNNADGVLITNGASNTLLSGNFIGTSMTGDSALGNRLDGVAIVNANGNTLAGCTFSQSPFVFYNVLSGNGGNGLRVTNSNNTTVQANFMGVGANNSSLVPNGGDGLLISGSSNNIQVGGVIPLGNVVAGNKRNGIEVRDTASGLISFNTFTGVFAFGGAAPNGQDGVLITSSGGDNLVRTCIVSGNLGNGIEIGGNATGVQVTDTAIGTNTNIQTAIPNRGDGIKITGHAHGNAIGGFQPSVEPQVTISSNNRYGIEVVGSAHDNVIFHSFIGTDYAGTAPLPNALGGIYLGPGTSSTVIGGSAPALSNLIANNAVGVIIQASNNNSVLRNLIENNIRQGLVLLGGRNNQIGSAAAGNTITGNGADAVAVSGLVNGSEVQGNTISTNAGNGVTLNSAQKVTIGGTAPGMGNRITGNRLFGLYASGNCNGSLVVGNTIVGNATGDVNLKRARGIKSVPPSV